MAKVPIGQTQLGSDEGLVSASRTSIILDAATPAWSAVRLSCCMCVQGRAEIQQCKELILIYVHYKNIVVGDEMYLTIKPPTSSKQQGS